MLFMSIKAFSETISETKPEMVLNFPAGDSSIQLGIDTIAHQFDTDKDYSANSILFTGSFFFILDNVNNRIVKYTSDFKFIDTIDCNSNGLIRTWISPPYLFAGYNSIGSNRLRNAFFFDYQKNKPACVPIDRINIAMPYALVERFGDTFYFQQRDGVYFGIKTTETDGKQTSIFINQTQLLHNFGLLNSNRYHLEGDLFFDHDQLISRAPKTVYRYFHNLRDFDPNYGDFINNCEFYPLPNGNYFFTAHREIWILSNTGKILQYSLLPKGSQTSGYTPSIDGYVYYLNADFDKGSTMLYRLGPFPELMLGYNGKVGICNDNNVNVRESSTVQSPIVARLSKGLPARILEMTKKPETIAGQTSVWLKIRLWDRTEGWVFGAFLDIPN
jgi:hypothetical protein